jgi:hypothetical protein
MAAAMELRRKKILQAGIVEWQTADCQRPQLLRIGFEADQVMGSRSTRPRVVILRRLGGMRINDGDMPLDDLYPRW